MNHSQEPPQERDWPANVPVPTFRRGSSLSSSLQEAGFEQQCDTVDAFLLYSNDEVRMRTISSGVLGAGQESTSTEGGTRKTRISFELHPSVFIEDFLLADADDNADDSLYGEPDDISEEDVVEALSNGSHMNALVSYLLGEDLNSNIRVPEAA